MFELLVQTYHKWLYRNNSSNRERLYGNICNNIGGLTSVNKILSFTDKGIRVNAISPGYFPKKKPNIPERPDYIEEITKRTPMKRIGKPDDLIGSVIYLASDSSSFVTGQNLIVDGGWSVW